MDLEALAEAAEEARGLAYAPYSGYSVGAALLDADGRVWTGCNIENVAYGSTMCAERVALFKMVSAGSRRAVAAALVTEDGGSPCGACLQVLGEFMEENGIVLLAIPGRIVRRLELSSLIPLPFRSERVNRTEPEPS